MQDGNQGQQGVIGKPIDRVDGRLKVTGGAKYAYEFAMPNQARAFILDATIGRGRIRSIDTRAAAKAPGVLAVITHENQPKEMAQPTNPPSGEAKGLLDPVIRYNGQHIAVVVAETSEQAEWAADLIKVEYDIEKPDAMFEQHLDTGFVPGTSNKKPTHKRGDFAAGVAQASKKVQQTYRTPVEHHNPMEPHATSAMWQGDMLTVYDATQGVVQAASDFAQQFNIPPENVHLRDPFVGGGFGSKGQHWHHAPLTAMAAKVVGRPVRCEVTRRQMFWNNGHRPPTHVDVTLGANNDGKLTAQGHNHHNHTSRTDEFLEPTGSLMTHVYSCPNVNVEHRLVQVDVPSPTYQRAPGESSGSFSLETAMDELAYELGIDPLELRLRNYAEMDESSGGIPYSSKSLRQCYEQAAGRFGWSQRNPAVGSMTRDGMLVGYGMATASYPSNFNPSSAKAKMTDDGRVLVQIATQDLGTGTYTILTQIAAEGLGISPDLVRVEIADSKLPQSGTSGGSQTATSAGSSVMMVAQALRSQITKFATMDQNTPLWNLPDNEIAVNDGRVYAKADPSKAMTYVEILRRYNKKEADATAFVKSGIERGNQSGSPQAQTDPNKKGGNAFHGFGAQFCEVHIDPDLRMARVARWTAAFALGKILNEKTLRSQLQGGIVWGIGMGLLEETYLDGRYGRFVNSNLAEYHVPVNRDAPDIDIILVPEKDTLVSPLGAKGGGEIGIVGVAAAIGNAIYHATGKRVRDLPITLDKIL
jgi:xanthine dehydrogenase YagR molybdenum-binding subunit